jgi:hypothetical protein
MRAKQTCCRVIRPTKKSGGHTPNLPTAFSLTLAMDLALPARVHEGEVAVTLAEVKARPWLWRLPSRDSVAPTHPGDSPASPRTPPASPPPRAPAPACVPEVEAEGGEVAPEDGCWAGACVRLVPPNRTLPEALPSAARGACGGCVPPFRRRMQGVAGARSAVRGAWAREGDWARQTALT